MSFEGLLNSTCTIQRATRTQDAYKSTTTAWVDHLPNIKCRRQLKKGDEEIAGGQLTEKATDVFFVLPGQDITAEDRISFKGSIYQIHLAETDENDMDKVAYLLCSKLASQNYA